MVIRMPAEFKKGGNQSLIEEIFNSRNQSNVVLDYTDLQWAFPISTLKVGMYIRKLARYRRQHHLQTIIQGVSTTNQCHNYLSHIGYFDFIGINHGNGMGSARGSSSYLPITRISKCELVENAKQRGTSIQGVILEKANQIACILLGYNEDSNCLPITYALKEVIRNVFEHSAAEDCFLFIQKYRNDVVQFAICDEGIGMKKSLEKKYAISNDYDAIQHAILPGVTSANTHDATLNPNGNSGYGLYALSELGQEYGWLEIGSGTINCMYRKQEVSKQILPFHDGVFVGLNLNNIQFDFREKLDEIIHNGEVLARTLGHNHIASSSSKHH